MQKLVWEKAVDIIIELTKNTNFVRNKTTQASRFLKVSNVW